jgi:hypothetical protein
MLIREHVLVRKISCCGGSAIKFRRRKGREEWEEGKKGQRGMGGRKERPGRRGFQSKGI